MLIQSKDDHIDYNRAHLKCPSKPQSVYDALSHFNTATTTFSHLQRQIAEKQIIVAVEKISVRRRDKREDFV